MVQKGSRTPGLHKKTSEPAKRNVQKLPQPGFLSESEWRMLHGLYTSFKSPAGYGGIKALKKQSGVSLAKVKQYLDGSGTYTKFRPSVETFPRLKVRSLGINHIWSLDLAFMTELAPSNGGVKYLLVAVDVLSRYLRVEPIKSKTSKDTSIAFLRMMEKDKVKPEKVWVDEGTEFEGAFSQMCSKLGIMPYHTYTETKSSFAERYIRTMKSVLWKYMHSHDSKKYVNKLPDMIALINSRVNRMIGMAPRDVCPEHTEYLLSLQDVPSRNLRSTRVKFQVGQTVRVAFRKGVFNKGYRQSFSNEVYKITAVSDKHKPITYWLQDIKNKTVKRRFYQDQLVPYTYNEEIRRARHQRVV